MNASILQYVVIVFGAAIAMACVWGVVSPMGLIRWVRTVFDTDWGMPMAIAVRVVLGVIFILVASETKFPMFFTIFGILMLVAAVVLPFVGKERLRRLLAWAEGWPAPGIRLWLLLGTVFGVFVAYGAL